MRVFAGSLFDGTTFRGPATLEVEGGRVAAILPGVDGRPFSDDVDLRDKVVLPAFVNTHAHLGMTLLRGVGEGLPLKAWLEEAILPREEHLSEEDVYWASCLGLLELMHAGVGTVADMYVHMAAVASAVLDAGPRAALARGLVGEGEEFAWRFAEAEALFAYEGKDGRIRVFYGPHAVYSCPPPSLREVEAAAMRRGTVVHIHVAETEDEVAECRARYGKPPLALLHELGFSRVPLLAVHMVHLDPEDAALLGTMDLAIAFCPVSNALLGSGIPPVSRYAESPGVRCSLGTDGAAPSTTLDFYLHLKALGWMEKGRTGDPRRLTAVELLRMATRGGGEALRLPAVGTLVPGAFADFQAVSLAGTFAEPERDLAALLVWAGRGEWVQDLYVAGRPVLREGQAVMLDEARVRREASRRRKALEAKWREAQAEEV